jgi:hypothetical protein
MSEGSGQEMADPTAALALDAVSLGAWMAENLGGDASELPVVKKFG